MINWRWGKIENLTLVPSPRSSSPAILATAGEGELTSNYDLIYDVIEQQYVILSSRQQLKMSIYQGDATCPQSHSLEPMEPSDRPCFFCGKAKKQGDEWRCGPLHTCDYQVCGSCFWKNTVIVISLVFTFDISDTFRRTVPISLKGWKTSYKIAEIVENCSAPLISKPINGNIALASKEQI